MKGKKIMESGIIISVATYSFVNSKFKIMELCKLLREGAYFQLKCGETYKETIGKIKELNGCSVWICNFSRIVHESLEKKTICDGTELHELIHGTTFLFAAALQSMEKETIFENYHHKNGHTILILSDKRSVWSYLSDVYNSEVY